MARSGGSGELSVLADRHPNASRPAMLANSSTAACAGVSSKLRTPSDRDTRIAATLKELFRTCASMGAQIVRVRV